MKIKRIFAPEIRQAIRMVRESLGPDAVILSNRNVDGGVEIVAALDLDAQALEAGTRTPEPATPSATPKPTGTESAKGPAAAMPATSTMDKAAKPLTNLANPFEQQAPSVASVLIGASSKSRAMAADAAERPLGAKEPALRVGSTRLEPDTARAPFERPKTKSEPAPLSAGAGSSPIDQILSEVRQELKGMRDMFNERLPVGATSLASNDRPVDGLAAKLAGLGFSTSLAHDVASGVRGDGDSKAVLATALERIAGRLTVAGGDAIDTAGVVALIGPTGVGKTTTLGKLAADFVLRHGGAELGLVTVDSYRIAAHEQLRTYGRLLGAPVRTAASSDELSRVLYDFRHKRLVLIDTTGMSQRDPRLNEQLSWLGEAGQPIQLYLTVSCATQSGAIAQVFNAYRTYGPAACVLTKLDEAVSYGAAISALIEHRLPLAYVCNGQRVPEDLHVGDADALLALCNAPPGASSTVPREFQAGERRMAHAYA